MRMAVIGAGLAGVSTALELALDGHEVSVFERRSGVAVEGSFAPGGWQATDWLAACGAAGDHTGQRHRGLSALAAAASSLRRPTQARWTWQQWSASAAPRAQLARQAAHQLARLSQQRQAQLTQALGLDYEQSQGSLVLLGKARELARFQPALARLLAAELPHQLLDAGQARQVEPGLTEDLNLAAALHLPGDRAGNCRQLAHLLKTEAQRRGVQFHFDAEVLSLQPGSPWQLRCAPTAQTSAEDGAALARPGSALPPEHRVDAVVLCTGATPAAWLTRLGASLPWLAWHGHTVTAPLPVLEAAPDLGPRSVVFDWRHQVQICRIGARVRVSGEARPGVGRPQNDRAAWDRLYQRLDAWFPGAARTSQAQEWRGLQARLPDLLPAIGSARHPGLWFNLGHGDQAWTWACGAARLLADQVSGRTAPDWSPALRPDRWP